MEERFGLSYEGFLEHLLEVAGEFAFQRLLPETNGVGQMPAQVPARAMHDAGRPGVVEGVSTTARLKADGLGFIKVLLQQRRPGLPRHPGLLQQLAALEYTVTETGGLRIAVPERSGHDDLAMSLCLAVLPLARAFAGASSSRRVAAPSRRRRHA